MIKKLLTLTFLLTLLTSVASTVRAGEGIVQMKAQDGTSGVCEIYSNLLDNFQYSVSVNCRGLQYPIAENLFQYVLWVQNAEGDYGTVGSLGIGKRQFTTNGPYSRMFVTKEAVGQPEVPSEYIYMSGPVRKSLFLEGSGVPLVANNPDNSQAEDSENQSQTTEPSDSNDTTADEADESIGDFGENQEATASSGGLGNAIRILGAVVVFIVVVVIAIAFISASRRRPVSI